MKYVVDTSVIIAGMRSWAGCITVPSVLDEVRDSHSSLNLSLSVDLEIAPPLQHFLWQVEEVCRKTGDVVSKTDMEVLAKALEVRGVVVSDDYAIQNLARALKLEVLPYNQPGIRKELEWVLRCSGCGRFYGKEMSGKKECPVCGSEVRRKVKR